MSAVRRAAAAAAASRMSFVRRCASVRSPPLRYCAQRRSWATEAVTTSAGAEEGPALALSARRLRQSKVLKYEQQLRNPDHVLISSRHARRRFGLTREDLATLPRVLKPNPYALTGSRTKEFPFFWKGDVVNLALNRHSPFELVRRYAEALDTEQFSGEWQRKIYAHAGARSRRWYNDPPSTTPEGRSSVQQGLVSNTIIWTLKAGVWWVTRSPAVFADAMHSFADVCNYLYRLQSLRIERPPDAKHPYGYAPLRSVCADRSFVMLLVLGGILPAAHGVQELWGALEEVPAIPPENMLMVSACVLGASVLLEAYAARVAAKEIQNQADRCQTTFRSALLHGRDLMSTATFLESTSGVVGGAIGLLGIGLTYVTECAWVEPAASVMMAGCVAAVASSLLSKSSEQLLQSALPEARVGRIIAILEDDEVVAAMYDVKTQVFASEMVRFKGEVHLNAEAVTRRRRRLNQVPSPASKQLLRELKDLEDEAAAEDWLMRNDAELLMATAGEIDRLEDIIREELRDFKRVHVDLEIF
eukprot:TRINITY_DN2019_c0_g1_i1.p1 TRINITY_DN2019_c0_g1~~TRINITY_DN2019_c0_g1_i1.p1  ORF type:complete len:531 (+),score=115.20 TRINITY_DN2019_c0_g1_i1:58-1650(+)